MTLEHAQNGGGLAWGFAAADTRLKAALASLKSVLDLDPAGFSQERLNAAARLMGYVFGEARDNAEGFGNVAVCYAMWRIATSVEDLLAGTASLERVLSVVRAHAAWLAGALRGETATGPGALIAEDATRLLEYIAMMRHMFGAARPDHSRFARLIALLTQDGRYIVDRWIYRHSPGGAKCHWGAAWAAAALHGSKREKAAEWAKWQQALDEYRAANPSHSYADARRFVARTFGVHADTVKKHTTNRTSRNLCKE